MSDAVVKVTFSSVNETRMVFSSLAALVTNLSFTIENSDDYKGIKVCTLDSNRVAVIHMFLEATVENLPHDGQVKICTSAKELAGYLKTVKDQNTVMFEYDQNQTLQMLKVRQFEQEKSAVGQVAEISIIDAPDEDELNTDFDYPYNCLIDLSELKEFISQSATFSADILNIQLKRRTTSQFDVTNYFTLQTDGSVKLKNYYFTEHTSVEDANNFVIDNTLAMRDEPEGEGYDDILSCPIGLKYIKEFIAPLSAIQVKLSLVNDMPIRLDYCVNETSYLTLFLTPRTIN